MKTWIIIVISVVSVALIIYLIVYFSNAKDRLNEKFFNAVRANNISLVQKLLNKHDFNIEKYKDRNSYTAMAITAMNGNTEMAKLFLDRNCDVNAPTWKRGYPALIFAVKEKNLAMAEFLINQGADVNAAFNSSSSGNYSTGITPLMLAVMNGDQEMVALLLDKGADLSAKGAWELTYGSDYNPVRAANFAYMAGMNKEEAVDYMFEQATKPHPAEVMFKPPFVLAIATGDNDLLAYLLERGADYNWRFEPKNSGHWTPPLAPGMNALMFAAINGNIKAMTLLIAKGVDVNAKDNLQADAMIYASKAGQSEAIKFLIDKGSDILNRDQDGMNALWYSIRAGAADAVRALLDAGASEDAGYRGLSPLMCAAEQNQPEIIDILVEYGFDVNEETKDGITAISIAARKGQLESMEHLIRKGAEIKNGLLDSRNQHGQTPLILAAGQGDIEKVRFLLENGADVNFPSGEGITPVMEAVWFGNLRTVQYLIDHGADIKSGNVYEQSLVWARQEGAFVIDPEKARKHVIAFGKKSRESDKPLPDEQPSVDEKVSELVNLRGVSAELYLSGKADIYQVVTEEKRNEYQKILELLEKVGSG